MNQDFSEFRASSSGCRSSIPPHRLAFTVAGSRLLRDPSTPFSRRSGRKAVSSAICSGAVQIGVHGGTLLWERGACAHLHKILFRFSRPHFLWRLNEKGVPFPPQSARRAEEIRAERPRNQHDRFPGMLVAGAKLR